MKKFSFKKISAVMAGVLLAGMTLGTAAAANYPAPFVSGGTANVAVVYGTGVGVSSLDLVESANIQSNLQSYMGASSSGSSASVSGNAASLASGSDYIYLMDEINEEVSVITSSELSTILADGTFTDDGGTNYNYEQTVNILGGAQFVFDDSENDLPGKDPALILNLTGTETTGVLNMSVVFDSAINFTSANSEGETIELFGKTYTIGTATDDNTLVLLGGSANERLDVGETKTLTVGDESYDVTLNAISSSTSAPSASITINGETKTFTQGQTKDVDGNDVYVKTVFKTGDNAGYIEIQLGASKLTLEDGSEVMVGSDNDPIDGTLVYLKGEVNNQECDNVTEIAIALAAPDNDANHVAVGESFVDPVFGSIKLNLASVANGPVIENMADISSSRYTLEVGIEGNRELSITATDKAGNTATLPFAYQNVTQDDSGNDIELYEGANLSKDEYFVLNSGSYQHFMQLTKVDVADTNGYVTIRDVFTGDTYSTTSGQNWTALGKASGDTLQIDGQTFTVVNNTGAGVSDPAVKIYSSDYGAGNGKHVAVYPYVETVNGKDHRFAITDEVTFVDGFGFEANSSNVLTLDLPTGSVTITGTGSGAKVDQGVTINSDGTTAANITLAGTNTKNMTVGTVIYNIGIMNDSTKGAGNYSRFNASVVGIASVSGANRNDNTGGYAGPGLLFVEDEDKQDSTVTDKNAVIVNTVDGTYSSVSAPIFTGTNNEKAFDDSDYTGYIDAFGTYVLFDSADANQEFATLTYPKDQMYADLYIAESDAVISGVVSSSGATQLGDILVKDSEVSSVATKNLIVVGGSCINSAAATLVGQAACGADWTTATGVGSGQFLIKGYASSDLTSGTALLVAGYDAADTVNAAKYLRTQTVDTSKEYLGTSATSADLVVA